MDHLEVNVARAGSISRIPLQVNMAGGRDSGAFAT